MFAGVATFEDELLRFKQAIERRVEERDRNKLCRGELREERIREDGCGRGFREGVGEKPRVERDIIHCENEGKIAGNEERAFKDDGEFVGGSDGWEGVSELWSEEERRIAGVRDEGTTAV